MADNQNIEYTVTLNSNDIDKIVKTIACLERNIKNKKGSLDYHIKKNNKSSVAYVSLAIYELEGCFQSHTELLHKINTAISLNKLNKITAKKKINPNEFGDISL